MPSLVPVPWLLVLVGVAGAGGMPCALGHSSSSLSPELQNQPAAAFVVKGLVHLCTPQSPVRRTTRLGVRISAKGSVSSANGCFSKRRKFQGLGWVAGDQAPSLHSPHVRGVPWAQLAGDSHRDQSQALLTTDLGWRSCLHSCCLAGSSCSFVLR